MTKRSDRRRMALALRHAELGEGRTGSNPSVGCVICDAYGNILAVARTADGGRPHAETRALDAAGQGAVGGTAYVTLEPCRERSTGEASCSTRLLEAGLSRVVVACRDLHPQGAGGIARLRAAGCRVDVGLKGKRAKRLYRDFFEHAIANETE